VTTFTSTMFRTLCFTLTTRVPCISFLKCIGYTAANGGVGVGQVATVTAHFISILMFTITFTDVCSSKIFDIDFYPPKTLTNLRS
jgi:hypothetical protein